MREIVNFLFETGILSKTPRSGFSFLGSWSQNVAEHTNRVCYIGYTLAMLDGTVDTGKVVQMCLFHDLAEGRTLDHNYVQQRYVKVDEHKAIEDITANIPFWESIRSTIHEYEERTSKESLLAKDADNLELLLFLKEQLDTGNENAKVWIDLVIERLKTDLWKSIGHHIINTAYNSWRLDTIERSWRINRTEQ